MIKDPNSIRMNDFLIKRSKPVSIYSNMLTFRDSNISFKLDGHFFKRMTYYDFIETNSSPQDQKLNFECGRELKFVIKRIGQKVTELNLLANCSNHLLSGLPRYQQ